MINHKHKFIFIHNPRMRGVSIELQFNQNEGKQKSKHWILIDRIKTLDRQTFNENLKFRG